VREFFLENRLILGEVMGQSIVSCFFDFVKYLQKNSVFDFVVSMHEEDLYTDRHKVDLAVWLSAGPDLGGGQTGQLSRALHN